MEGDTISIKFHEIVVDRHDSRISELLSAVKSKEESILWRDEKIDELENHILDLSEKLDEICSEKSIIRECLKRYRAAIIRIDEMCESQPGYHEIRNVVRAAMEGKDD